MKKNEIFNILRKPNANEDWLDVQARALCQATKLICKLMIKEQQL